MRKLQRIITLAAIACLAACAAPAAAPQGPSKGAELAANPAQAAPFVIAANPLAAEAGRAVLARGGSAVDAAIAIQAMLSLVEPQSSGIGGGAFLTYYDAASRKVMVYDGREVAPGQASPTMFLGNGGAPLPFGEAVLSGRATGVPGVVAMLAMAHREHGRLAWSDLFDDAARTAEDGFVVSPRLARMIAGRFPQNAAPDVRAYFARPGGGLLGAGDRLRNPAYAGFLRRLARNGPQAFYGGETGARIVARTRAAPLGGAMTLADLARYRPIRREALCGPWAVYVVCTPPPPSSGVALLQLLALLDRTAIARLAPDDPEAWFLFAEASRVMFADRDRYIGDPAFVRVPVAGLLDPDYVAARARLIGDRAGAPPVAGTPPGAPAAAADRTREPAGTSHFIVRDRDGNAVSMTTTVESIFGSGRMVDGFFLNNQMTDFNFSPTDAHGRPAANAVAPGKRPRSSMVPTILLTGEGRFAGAIGSAGGSAILPYVGKTLVAAVLWRMPVQDAVALPNLVARGDSFQGENARMPPAVIDGLRARGIEIRPGQGEDSGIHAVLIRDGRIDGGYDPRREGVVVTLPR